MEIQSKLRDKSQGIRLPKTDMNKTDSGPDDTPLIRAQEGVMIPCQSFRHKTLEERAAEYGGHLNLNEELEWRGAPRGKEVW